MTTPSPAGTPAYENSPERRAHTVKVSDATSPKEIPATPGVRRDKSPSYSTTPRAARRADGNVR